MARSIDDVLSEKDLIHHLLEKPGFATPKQCEVINFPTPEDKGVSTLLIKGGSGSGKTLCLISKLIQHARAISNASSNKGRILCLCFNKNLDVHIRELLDKHFPKEGAYIDVYNVYKYAQQLINPVERCTDEELKKCGKFAGERFDVWNKVSLDSTNADATRINLFDAFERIANFTVQPKYSAVAIDEAQDLKEPFFDFLSKTRESESAFLYIAGDVHQDIYQTKFDWNMVTNHIQNGCKEVILDKNLRNPPSIAEFSNALIVGKPCTKRAKNIEIVQLSIGEAKAKAKEISKAKPGETTLLLLNVSSSDLGQEAEKLSKEFGIPVKTGDTGILEPGLYVLTNYTMKGLEFDNVIVADATKVNQKGNTQDYKREKTIRYCQFSRARKRLFIYYDGEPPRLLKEFYSVYLP